MKMTPVPLRYAETLAECPHVTLQVEAMPRCVICGFVASPVFGCIPQMEAHLRFAHGLTPPAGKAWWIDCSIPSCETLEHVTAERDAAQKRVEEFADQLRYLLENVACEVYAFGECQCDPAAGDTPCAFCASKHFINWYREQLAEDKATACAKEGQ